MWPFKRKEYEKLGYAWSSSGVIPQLQKYLRVPREHIHLRDADWRGIPSKEFEKIVFKCWFPLDLPTFRKEIWDCDNWCVAFMYFVQVYWAKISKGKEALAFGYAEAEVEGLGWHAFIWHMDDKGAVRTYEPQHPFRQVDYKFENARLVEA